MTVTLYINGKSVKLIYCTCVWEIDIYLGTHPEISRFLPTGDFRENSLAIVYIYICTGTEFYLLIFISFYLYTVLYTLMYYLYSQIASQELLHITVLY